MAAKAANRRAPARRAAPPVAVPNPVRELAKRIVAVTLANDDDATFALYDESIESTEMGMPPVKGIDGLRQKYAQWRAMASDSTWKARNVWVDGNSIVIEWAGRATINGKSIDLKEIAVHEIRNGKIVRERFYYDTTPFQPSAAGPDRTARGAGADPDATDGAGVLRGLPAVVATDEEPFETALKQGLLRVSGIKSLHENGSPHRSP